jgi:Na+:H+ antiporter, NhaA family
VGRRVTERPFQRFVQTEAAGGVLLFLAGLAAIVVANSPWANGYTEIWNTEASIAVGTHALSLTLHQWINDGLMAVFFLLVGLEIKRELIAGELASLRHAALPIAGAVGGMIVPAGIFWLFNGAGQAARGWGIPMATDIAFALGALALIAPRIPIGAKVFLAALAIVDDMGAVLVIALFYTSEVGWEALAGAGGALAVLVAMNFGGIRLLLPYLVVGVVLWYFVHESGVHATVAGVLLAFTIPTRTRINALQFSAEARSLIDEFDRTETGDYLVLTSKGQQEALFGLERVSEAVTEPLLRLEHGLHGFSAFFVMPIFAFANAGVAFGGSIADANVAVGAALGLAIGKPLGITAAAYAAVTLGYGALPKDVSWTMLHACAWLGGIGFTMSLFIAALAFDGTPLLDAAKVGIMTGSLVAGVVATLVMRLAPMRPDDAQLDAPGTSPSR